MSFVSNVIWLTVVLCTGLKPNAKFCMGLKGIQRLECITVVTEVAAQLFGNFHLFCTQLCTVSVQEKKWKRDSTKNYLKESLLSILCFIIHGQGSSEKGILNCESEIYFSATRCNHFRSSMARGKKILKKDNFLQCDFFISSHFFR